MCLFAIGGVLFADLRVQIFCPFFELNYLFPITEFEALLLCLAARPFFRYMPFLPVCGLSFHSQLYLLKHKVFILKFNLPMFLLWILILVSEIVA